MNLVFVIVPAFNEAPVIRSTIQNILLLGFKIVVVDDGSTQALKSEIFDLPIHYIRHEVNLGQGAAIQTGIQYSIKKGATHCVTFDADGQHFYHDIIPMLTHLESNSLDIVFGSRFLKNSFSNVPKLRKFQIDVARYINLLLTGVLLSDAHNGLRVFNRRFASNVRLTENGMAHASEILYLTKRGNFKFSEYPITLLYTEYSKRKGQKFIHSFKVLQDIIFFDLFK